MHPIMTVKIRNAVSLFTCGVLITAQSIAAGVVPEYGAAGTYNPELPISKETAVSKPINGNAGSFAQGAGLAGSSAGLSTTAIVTTAVVVAAAATAIAVGASSSGGTSSPSHH